MDVLAWAIAYDRTARPLTNRNCFPKPSNSTRIPLLVTIDPRLDHVRRQAGLDVGVGRYWFAWWGWDWKAEKAVLFIIMVTLRSAMRIVSTSSTLAIHGPDFCEKVHIGL
jgi:hypothetical protein